ncbi:hypothetical protein Scep_007016 [Stephania cephalantha]|uniref:Uncharacterized protein n=1 Tax=Stephania cephalantha TaxID=152367 RepID=A0AAP0KAQ0_9MAGN
MREGKSEVEYQKEISEFIDEILVNLEKISQARGVVQVGNHAMDSSYPHNYGRFEDSHYYNVNRLCITTTRLLWAHVKLQIPQHEGNQQFHQNTSLEDMVKQLIDNQQKVNRILEEIREIDFEISGLKDLETQLIQYNVRLQNMTYEEKLCSTQPIFNPEEDVSVDTLKNFEVNEVTWMDDYLRETLEECEVFQIEPEIVIALNEGENEMKIDVISDKPEKP